VDAIDIPSKLFPTDMENFSDDSSYESLDNFIDSFNTKFGYPTKQTLEPELQQDNINTDKGSNNQVTEVKEISIENSFDGPVYHSVINSNEVFPKSSQKTNFKVNTKVKQKNKNNYPRTRKDSSHVRIEPAPTRFIHRKQSENKVINFNPKKTIKSVSVAEEQLHNHLSEGEGVIYRAPVLSTVHVLFAATEVKKLGMISKVITEDNKSKYLNPNVQQQPPYTEFDKNVYA